MRDGRIYVQSLDKLPAGAHWVIFEGGSVHVEGDERSRTAPGHGYPAHTVSYLTYVAYTEEKHWLAEIEKREKAKPTWHREEYRAFKVYPAEIKRSVGVRVEVDTPEED